MTFSVLLAGMFTPPPVAEIAYSRHNADVVLADRYLGLGPIDDTYRRARDRVGEIAEKHGRVHLKTHSLGGNIGARIGLRHPELVERVDAIASPFDGIGKIPPCLLQLVAIPGVRDLLLDHDRITDFQSQVSRDWSPEVQLRLIALAWDIIVNPRRSAWALNPPKGCSVGKYWVGPLKPRPGRLPADVCYVRGLYGFGHLTAIFNGSLSALT